MGTTAGENEKISNFNHGSLRCKPAALGAIAFVGIGQIYELDLWRHKGRKAAILETVFLFLLCSICLGQVVTMLLLEVLSLIEQSCTLHL